MKISADNTATEPALHVKLLPSWDGDQCSKEVEVGATLSSPRASVGVSFFGWLNDDDPDEIKMFLTQVARLSEDHIGEANLRLSGVCRTTGAARAVELKLFSLDSLGLIGISLRLSGESRHASGKAFGYGAFGGTRRKPAGR
jgi:hypothetical protein